jgi:NADP-dependent 3-hydroxy acid dehydrogenase YdfG
MKEFEDKVAVVTGAASGIGRGNAETFTAAAMKVVRCDIETEALEKTTRSMRAAGGPRAVGEHVLAAIRDERPAQIPPWSHHPSAFSFCIN